MQTAAYAVAFEELTGIPIGRLVIIMAVDNDVIKSKINALTNKINMCESELREMTQVSNELLSIQEPEDPSNPIIDKGTGVQMTESRRQEIYDANIVRADALL